MFPEWVMSHQIYKERYYTYIKQQILANQWFKKKIPDSFQVNFVYEMVEVENIILVLPNSDPTGKMFIIYTYVIYTSYCEGHFFQSIFIKNGNPRIEISDSKRTLNLFNQLGKRILFVNLISTQNSPEV